MRDVRVHVMAPFPPVTIIVYNFFSLPAEQARTPRIYMQSHTYPRLHSLPPVYPLHLPSNAFFFDVDACVRE